MSALGHNRSLADVGVTSAFTSRAAESRTFRQFAFVPATDVSKCSKWQGETAPGYRLRPAEKAHARFARDQLRSA